MKETFTYILSLDKEAMDVDKEKTPEQLQKEKEQLKVQNQKTENVFEDKSRVPNEQNAWKETQYKR
jgi:hypothetical protein